jgi:hypothetical protein
VLKDSSGIPAPKIDYTLSENSRKHDRPRRWRAASEILRSGRRDEIGRDRRCSMRLASDGHGAHGHRPERSVVNEWGRSHDVKNLFIVDGSIFVTSGGVNPTSTIQALALYIADNMKRRLADATLFD